MAWESGIYPYSRITEILQSRLKKSITIHVKGHEKRKWIEEMVPGK